MEFWPSLGIWGFGFLCGCLGLAQAIAKKKLILHGGVLRDATKVNGLADDEVAVPLTPPQIQASFVGGGGGGSGRYAGGGVVGGGDAGVRTIVVGYTDDREQALVDLIAREARVSQINVMMSVVETLDDEEMQMLGVISNRSFVNPAQQAQYQGRITEENVQRVSMLRSTRRQIDLD